MRVLTDEEIPTIVPLVQHYLEASQLPIAFRAEKVVAFWANRYQLQTGELCGSFQGNQLVGLFGVHTMDSSFGDVLYAHEWIWWMEPGFRKGPAGMELLAWAESWSTARGLGLSVGSYDCVHGDVMARFYKRRGYQRQGSVYIKSWEVADV
ncbi:MAG: hypothetical protein ABIU97_07355 [Dehalococcoidia bacterium]